MASDGVIVTRALNAKSIGRCPNMLVKRITPLYHG